MEKHFQKQSQSASLSLWNLGAALATYKTVLLGIMFLSLKLLPAFFSLESHRINFHLADLKSPTFQAMLSTWDGQMFLYLSQNGYVSGTLPLASYPLWPWFISLFSIVTLGNHFVAGLILSNLFSLAGLVLFYRLVQEDLGEEIAKISLLLLLAFPGALFFSFIYSESLFFLLAMLFFISLKRSNEAGIFLTSLAMTLTRAVGAFALLPILWYLYETRAPLRKWLVSSGPILGCAFYFAILYAFTGDPLAGMTMQKDAFIAHASLARLFDLTTFWKSLTGPLSFRDLIFSSPFDRLWLLWFFGSLYPIWKVRKTYFFYALAVGMIPVITNSFPSYTRFVLMAFPMFIVTAKGLASQNRQAWLWVFLGSLFSLQILFLLLHINFLWVS